MPSDCCYFVDKAAAAGAAPALYYFGSILHCISVFTQNLGQTPVTKKLFQKDRRNANERQIYQLSRQALLSTAELIKCVEYDIRTIHSESQLMDALYADSITTSDNIADMVRPLSCCRPVLQAVANLYLRRQIIFERLS